MRHVSKITSGYSSMDPHNPFTIRMDFRDTDPLAVSFTFHVEEHPEGEIRWEFGRELLEGGLRDSAGSGDIIITRVEESLSVLLRSPSGSAIIELEASDVEQFVGDVNNLSPHGTESDVVERDLACFLANPMEYKSSDKDEGNEEPMW